MPSLAGKLLQQTASIALETKSLLAIAAGLLWEPACWRFRGLWSTCHRLQASSYSRQQTAAIALETKSLLAIAAGLLWEPACWRFRGLWSTCHRLQASSYGRQHSSLAGKLPQQTAFVPCWQACAGAAHARASTGPKATPVCVPKRTRASGVMAATMRPPALPPSGPRSMTQSASAITSRSCSITTTL